MDTSLDREFVARSESIVTQLGFRDLKSFVKNQTLLMLMAKIEKYETEIRRFKVKYGIDFIAFQERINRKDNQEEFSEEDDFLDWRFAEEALKRFQRQTRELENA